MTNIIATAGTTASQDSLISMSDGTGIIANGGIEEDLAMTHTKTNIHATASTTPMEGGLLPVPMGSRNAGAAVGDQPLWMNANAAVLGDQALLYVASSYSTAGPVGFSRFTSDASTTHLAFDSSPLNLPPGASGSDLVPIIQPSSDPTASPTPHVFLRGASGPPNILSVINHFIDNMGSGTQTCETLTQINGTPLQFSGYNPVAFTRFSGGVIVGEGPDAGDLVSPAQVGFYIFRWQDLRTGTGWSANTPKIIVTPPAQYQVANNHADFAISAVTYYAPDSDGDQAEWMLFALQCDTGVLFGECQITQTTDGSYALATDAIDWTTPGVANIGSRGLHVGGDGQIYFCAIPMSQGFTPTLYLRDPAADTWTAVGNPLNGMTLPAGTVGLQRLSLIYAQGTPISSQPSPVNPSLIDVTMPLNRIVIATTWSPTSQDLSYQSTPFGTLRRRGLQQVPGLQKQLIGIIDGPPPVPVENINIKDQRDPNIVANGQTVFAYSQSTGNQVSLNWSAALLFQSSAKVSLYKGFFTDIKGTIDLELKLAYQGVYTDESYTTATSSFTCPLNLQGKLGTPQGITVQPYGLAIICGMDWTGYAYEYVAPDGTVPPNAPAYRQVFPADVVVTGHGYAMNPDPAVGPIPGNLLSYVLEEDEQAALNTHNVFELSALGATTNHLTNSWSIGGTTNSEWEQYQATEFANGFAIDYKAMLGAQFSTLFIADGSVKAGTQLQFAAMWSETQSTQVGLSSGVTVPGNGQVAGTYAYYDYYTYQLGSDNEWATDFLNGIIVPKVPPVDPTDLDPNDYLFPTNLSDLDTNMDLWSMIAPGSTPFKICYAVGSYRKVVSLEEALAEAGVALSPSVQRAFEEAGIRTTSEAAAALTASRRGEGHQRAKFVDAATAGVPTDALLRAVQLLGQSGEDRKALDAAIAATMVSVLPRAA